MNSELETLAEFDPDKIAVSRTGTRHVIRTPQTPGSAWSRITCLCSFTIRPDGGPFEASRDCLFCLELLNQQRRKAAAAAPEQEPEESTQDLLAVPALPESAA